jgi:hypothetical protein
MFLAVARSTDKGYHTGHNEFVGWSIVQPAVIVIGYMVNVPLGAVCPDGKMTPLADATEMRVHDKPVCIMPGSPFLF